MAAKAIAISSIYTLVTECERHFGLMSPVTRTVGGLGALIFAALWTEIIYFATRTASDIANAQWKGWVATAAGGTFALAATTTNIFLMHPLGVAVAVSGSLSAIGLWLSLYVATLRQLYGDPYEG